MRLLRRERSTLDLVSRSPALREFEMLSGILTGIFSLRKFTIETEIMEEIAIKIYLIPLSRSLIIILKRTGPNTEPLGTPLVTSLRLDLTPFTITLCQSPL